MVIGEKNDLIVDFQNVSGKVNNRASGIVYTGKEQQGNKTSFTKKN